MNETNLKTNDPWSSAVELKGRKLLLQPFSSAHLDDLERNLFSPQNWHCVHWGIKTRAELEKALDNHIQQRKAQTGNCFAMVVESTGEAVGISRFLSFNRPHNYLEIGGTWIGEKWQKTFVNTEAKLMMLTYVFETLRCQRVEFRVDSLNFNSQRGVLRLGAKYEGEMRQSCILPDGRKRDYRLYSILDSEWPNVKGTLNWYLDKYV